ncbi:unnamed protein product, partial [Didymodactylos carnosus]
RYDNRKIITQHGQYHNVWEFENEWYSGLCKCKPAKRCCFAWFCYPCFMCKVAKQNGEEQWLGCCPCSLFGLRTKLRTARRIKGSLVGDCCVSSFCKCCTALQLANELESQGLF